MISTFERAAYGRTLSRLRMRLSDTVPIQLGLMLDKSLSMERDLEAASKAAIRFVSDFPEARDVTLVEFERTVRLGRYEPLNYPQLFERMRDRKMGWGTALYDALGRYVESTRDRTGHPRARDVHRRRRFDERPRRVGSHRDAARREGDAVRHRLHGARGRFLTVHSGGHAPRSSRARPAGRCSFRRSPRDLDRIYAHDSRRGAGPLHARVRVHESRTGRDVPEGPGAPGRPDDASIDVRTRTGSIRASRLHPWPPAEACDDSRADAAACARRTYASDEFAVASSELQTHAAVRPLSTRNRLRAARAISRGRSTSSSRG